MISVWILGYQLVSPNQLVDPPLMGCLRCPLDLLSFQKSLGGTSVQVVGRHVIHDASRGRGTHGGHHGQPKMDQLDVEALVVSNLQHRLFQVMVKRNPCSMQLLANGMLLNYQTFESQGLWPIITIITYHWSPNRSPASSPCSQVDFAPG